MRKLLVLLIASVLMLPAIVFAAEPQDGAEVTAATPTVQEEETGMPKDLDLEIDENVEIDVIMDYIVGSAELTELQKMAADINDDGYVNVLDVQQMLNEAVKTEE